MCDDEDDCCTIIRGPQGDTGFQGRIAMRGAQGEIGYQSDIVIIGNQGPQGAMGSAQLGFLGPPGVQGPLDLLGAQGTVGNNGFASTYGPQGTSGDRGPQGFQGLSEIGTQGPQGFEHAGFQGAIGRQGYPDRGPQGFTGSVIPIQTTPVDDALFFQPGVSPTTIILPSMVVGPGTYNVICNLSIQNSQGNATLTFQLPGSTANQIITVSAPNPIIYYRVYLQSRITTVSASTNIGPLVSKSITDPALVQILVFFSLLIVQVA